MVAPAMDPKELTEWTSRHCSHNECPFCRGSEWIGFPDATDAEEIMLGRDPGGGIVGLACRACGFVRLISMQVVGRSNLVG